MSALRAREVRSALKEALVTSLNALSVRQVACATDKASTTYLSHSPAPMAKSVEQARASSRQSTVVKDSTARQELTTKSSTIMFVTQASSVLQALVSQLRIEIRVLRRITVRLALGTLSCLVLWETTLHSLKILWFLDVLLELVMMVLIQRNQ